MARVALIAVATAGMAAGAAAAPLSLSFDAGDGAVWARGPGLLRDDAMVTLRVGVGVGDRATADAGVSYDLEHLEAALRLGSRVRLGWQARGTLYLHGELAIVSAAHLASNYDLLAGVGHWGRVAALAPWLAWYAEASTVVRVGDYAAVSARVDLGLALATSSFWGAR